MHVLCAHSGIPITGKNQCSNFAELINVHWPFPAQRTPKTQHQTDVEAIPSDPDHVNRKRALFASTHLNAITL